MTDPELRGQEEGIIETYREIIKLATAIRGAAQSIEVVKPLEHDLTSQCDFYCYIIVDACTRRISENP